MVSPLQLQAELELTWIVRRCCLTGVSEQLVHVGNVEFVRDIEYVGAHLQIEALIEVDQARDAQVVEHRPRLEGAVAREIAVKREEIRDACCEEIGETRFLEESGWRVLRCYRVTTAS